MVTIHQSARHYVDDDGSVHDYEVTLLKALNAVKRIILVAHHATAPIGPRLTHALPYFEKYFGSYDANKAARVKAVLDKLYQLVENETEVDITFHVGSKHLSGATEVFIKDTNKNVECVIDLSKRNAFDHNGTYQPSSQALLPEDTGRFDGAHNTDLQAFSTGSGSRHLGFKSGSQIFINPRNFHESDCLAPIEGERIVKEADLIDDYHKLPALLLHELCHSSIMGPAEEQFDDEHAFPDTISKTLPDEITVQFNGRTDQPQPLYGDRWCSLVANCGRPEESRKCLKNPDSYQYFILSIYMKYLNWCFRDGSAKSVNVNGTTGAKLSSSSAFLGNQLNVVFRGEEMSLDEALTAASPPNNQIGTFSSMAPFGAPQPPRGCMI